jgi:hypothetical protein
MVGRIFEVLYPKDLSTGLVTHQKSLKVVVTRAGKIE